MSFLILQILFIFISPILGFELLPYCQPTSCGKKNGPSIQFPFRHTQEHPHYCGYPGFELSCDNNGETILQLPSSINVSVTRIDYKSQRLHFRDLETCLARRLPNLNLSASPFQFQYSYLDDYVLFSCSNGLKRDSGLVPITCLGGTGYQVFSLSSGTDTDLYTLTDCTKINTVSSVPWYALGNRDVIELKWSQPPCDHCEARGRYCRFANNTVGNPIVCVNKPGEGLSRNLKIACSTIGSFLFVATLAALYYLYRSYKTDKKIEKFLQNYKALKPARFSYADLRRITKDFGEKLGEGGYGIVYKGKLSEEIYVAVKVLNNTKGNGEEFINEVGTIGSIHHVNIVRLVGFCADGFRRALVYEFLPNDSLEKFIFQDGSKNNSLGCEKMQDIALGIAKGIEYLHQGCDQQILHFDIKPNNILLDHNLNPKICDFGLAKFCNKEQSAVSMTDARGTMGYIAPEVMSRTFGKVSYKSDIYSFGMMLLEMVGGRKNIDATVNKSQVYFPKWIYNQLSQGEEILLKIDEGDDDKIVKKLTIVGLWCIQWYPADRPTMKAVVQMLEGDGENLTLPPSPFPATGMINNVAGMNRMYFETELTGVPESDEQLNSSEERQVFSITQ